MNFTGDDMWGKSERQQRLRLIAKMQRYKLIKEIAERHKREKKQ